jgi:hypothetical protein
MHLQNTALTRAKVVLAWVGCATIKSRRRVFEGLGHGSSGSGAAAFGFEALRDLQRDIGVKRWG